MELCEHGNLLNFLRKNRQETSGRTGGFVLSLDPLLRVRIAYDVAKGMHYLEEKKVQDNPAPGTWVCRVDYVVGC